MNCTDFAGLQGSPKNGCNFQRQIYKIFRKILQNQLLKGENLQIKAMASNSKLLCVCDKKPKLQEFLRNSDQRNQMTLAFSWNSSRIPLLPFLWHHSDRRSWWIQRRKNYDQYLFFISIISNTMDKIGYPVELSRLHDIT